MCRTLVRKLLGPLLVGTAEAQIALDSVVNGEQPPCTHDNQQSADQGLGSATGSESTPTPLQGKSSVDVPCSRNAFPFLLPSVRDRVPPL